VVNLTSAIETIRIAHENGLTPDEVVLQASPNAPAVTPRSPRSQYGTFSLAQNMKHQRLATRNSDAMKAIIEGRLKLPIRAETVQSEILRLVKEHDVLIILAATGSGKTTQVPQILLDEKIIAGEGPSASIICTQPRRIAATSIARKVMSERPGDAWRSVGYHVRGDYENPSRYGSITYCTAGILLNRLISDADFTLSQHSHIIVDEVHVRDLPIDVVLSLLRTAARKSKAMGKHTPKIILMSATIDPARWLEYFAKPDENGTSLAAASIDIEGVQAHIEEHFLQDILDEVTGTENLPESIKSMFLGQHAKSSQGYVKWELEHAAKQTAAVEYPDQIRALKLPSSEPSTNERALSPNHEAQRDGLAAATIAFLAHEKPLGDILAFFPSSRDMDQVEELLCTLFSDTEMDVRDPEKFRIFKLHSQRRKTNDLVFQPVPPGCRRIILTTNIAETSLTLPEVEYVVDTGMERILQYDTTLSTRMLTYLWIAK
jgi:ATP-dependent RNA helicase DHX36